MTGEPYGGWLKKPSRAARKAEAKKDDAKSVKTERDNKAVVRRRDGHRCRFPLCGCRLLALPLEVSHETQHKGMGGDRTGARSQVRDMMLLCDHRHRRGAVSRHAGTLRSTPTTRDGYDGPIVWKMAEGDRWRELAREIIPGVFEPFTPWQRKTLEELGRMER